LKRHTSYSILLEDFHWTKLNFFQVNLSRTVVKINYIQYSLRVCFQLVYKTIRHFLRSYERLGSTG
jgi:hypothetical protein